jgi:hypothetical protein
MKGGIIGLSKRLVSYTGFQVNANKNRGKDKNKEDNGKK